MKRAIGFALIKIGFSASVVLAQLMILIVVVPTSASAQVKEEWVAIYDAGNNESSLAMATDSTGNVFMVGRSGYDYVAVKYNAEGTALWATKYEFEYPGAAETVSIAVDEFDHVYVAGRGGTDYVLIKYDSSGNLLWVEKYAGSGDGLSTATGLVIDGAGNVYITGVSSETGGFYYTTIKYDPDGQQQWIRQLYSGTEYIFSTSAHIAVDHSGNAYVTGSSTLPSGTYEYITAKYNATGNEVWIAHYPGPGDRPSAPGAIGIDAAGDIYVTGIINYFYVRDIYGDAPGNFTYDSYATVKYDPNGNQRWTNIYAGVNYYGGSLRFPFLAVDDLGNAHTAMTICISGGSNCGNLLVKYDTDGNELWSARYNSFLPTGLATDTAGNSYVTGLTGDYPYGNVTTAYDINGNELWSYSYNGPGNGATNVFYYPSSIITDSSDNVFVTGTISGYRGNDSVFFSDYATVKLMSNSNANNADDGNSNGGGSSGVCFIRTMSPWP